MIHENIPIKERGSLEGAHITTYILSHSEEIPIEKRPLIILCPGGGYCFLSEREAEMLALQWNALGYHAAVLWYSVAPATYPTALLELGRAVSLFREKAGKWHIDPDKILVEGSSAGGHLAASYGMFWKKPFLADSLEVFEETLRPNGLILNYPVITSGPYAHEDSFRQLLGDAYDEKKEEMSLEKQVNADMPPAFIWSTDEDGCVPAENALFLALAMRKCGVSVELHLYAKGGHGLSLADERTIGQGRTEVVRECQSWMDLAHTWLQEVIL